MSPTTISSRSPGKPRSGNGLHDIELGASPSTSKRRSGVATHKDDEVTALVVDEFNDNNNTPATTLRSASRNNNTSEGESSSTVKSIVASALYSGCSVGMVLVNKSLASRYVLSWCADVFCLVSFSCLYVHPYTNITQYHTLHKFTNEQ